VCLYSIFTQFPRLRNRAISETQNGAISETQNGAISETQNCAISETKTAQKFQHISVLFLNCFARYFRITFPRYFQHIFFSAIFLRYFRITKTSAEIPTHFLRYFQYNFLALFPHIQKPRKSVKKPKKPQKPKNKKARAYSLIN